MLPSIAKVIIQMAKQPKHLHLNGRDPQQMHFLLNAQATELKNLRALQTATANNLSVCQLLLATIIGDNPREVDLTAAQTYLVNKQINFKQLDATHIQIYLTDKPAPGDNPSATETPKTQAN